MFTVQAAECHEDTCLDVVSADGHYTNVNPIGFTDDLWRVDCDSCMTCIRSGLSKSEALNAAKRHILEVLKCV